MIPKSKLSTVSIIFNIRQQMHLNVVNCMHIIVTDMLILPFRVMSFILSEETVQSMYYVKYGKFIIEK